MTPRQRKQKRRLFVRGLVARAKKTGAYWYVDQMTDAEIRVSNPPKRVRRQIHQAMLDAFKVLGWR